MNVISFMAMWRSGQEPGASLKDVGEPLLTFGREHERAVLEDRGSSQILNQVWPVPASGLLAAGDARLM